MHSPSSRGSSYDHPTKPDSFSTVERKMFSRPLYLLWPSPCLNLKVFYVKLRNCEFHKSTPELLSLNYTPLSPETMVEVNGRRSDLSTPASVSSTLRRDRIDKKSEEAIFVSTDNIRMSGSMRFEVYGGENLLFSGVLELSIIKKWSLKCQPAMSDGFYFLGGKEIMSSEVVSWPAIEVYVAGLFSGSAVILNKTLYLGMKKKKKKNQMSLALNSVPEDETTGIVNNVLGPQQLMNYEGFDPENNFKIDSNSGYRRSEEYIEVEDGGDLSLFISGVSVGVGIGLSIFLCVGVATDLLFRTYKITARNFKRLL